MGVVSEPLVSGARVKLNPRIRETRPVGWVLGGQMGTGKHESSKLGEGTRLKTIVRSGKTWSGLGKSRAGSGHHYKQLSQSPFSDVGRRNIMQRHMYDATLCTKKQKRNEKLNEKEQFHAIRYILYR